MTLQEISIWFSLALTVILFFGYIYVFVKIKHPRNSWLMMIVVLLFLSNLACFGVIYADYEIFDKKTIK